MSTNTTLAGIRSTGNTPSTLQKRSVDERIAELEPSKTPFQKLQLALGQKRRVTNPKFEMLEQRRPARVDVSTTTMNGTTTSTTVTLTNVGFFKVGDLIRELTGGEVAVITSINSSVATVTRALGGDVSTWNAGVSIMIVGTAFPEGSNNPDVLARELEVPYNYVQIARRNFYLTKTQQNTNLYGEQDAILRNRENVLEHAIDIEMSLLFGKRDILSGTTSAPRRTTGGLLWYLDQASSGAAVTASIATLNYSDVDAWARELFKYDDSDKVVFVGNLALSAFNMMAKGGAQMTLSAQSKEFGVRIFRYVTAHGVLGLVPHRLMNQAPYNGYAIAITPANVKLTHLRPEMTEILNDVQTPGQDAKESGLLSEYGLQLVLPETHGYLAGITAGAE